jgi:hypothetical protein
MKNARTTSSRLAWRSAALAGVLGGLLLFGGCDEDCVFCTDCDEPLAPVDVYSVTGDGQVTLYWTAVRGGHDDAFIVYRSIHADGPYEEIAHTRRDLYVDDDVRNGRTYYYAVSTLNACGDESKLSRELVHDTPRPEGFGAYLDDANGDGFSRSGWDFSDYRALPWNHEAADVYFVISQGGAFLVAADLNTDIQDAGYGGFDDVDWAPEGGWSPTGTVEAVPGHMFVVWTRDNHFAKVRVRTIESGRLTFDWAYQIDGGNRELAPRPGGGLRSDSIAPRPTGRTR